MGESFQDYSVIQNFETDFPQKVSLKILNLGDYISFSVLFSLCLWTIAHLNLKVCIFNGHTASFKIGVWKVQDFGNFELSPMYKWHQVFKCTFEPPRGGGGEVSWGEGLFIFRELWSTGNYFMGAGEQGHNFGDLGSTAEKLRKKHFRDLGRSEHYF